MADPSQVQVRSAVAVSDTDPSDRRPVVVITVGAEEVTFPVETAVQFAFDVFRAADGAIFTHIADRLLDELRTEETAKQFFVTELIRRSGGGPPPDMPNGS